MEAAAPLTERRLPGWRAWLTATVFAPLAMIATGVTLLGLGTSGAIATTAFVFALVYAAAAHVTRLDLWAVLGSYVLAAVLTVPWAFGIFFAWLAIACPESGCFS